MSARVALVLAALAGKGLAQTGDTKCPCIDIRTDASVSSQMAAFREGDKFVYKPEGSTSRYFFDLSYGSSTCKAHDDGVPPSCNVDPKPGWCSASWCYVNPDNCNSIAKISTRFFPTVEKLYFSYATCAGAGASTNTVDGWTASDTKAAQNVIQLIEDYGRGARFTLEDIYKNQNSSSWSACSTARNNMCPCSSCSQNTVWQSKLDFFQTGYLQGLSGSPFDKARAQCLSTGISSTYKTVAAKEADPNFGRVGFEYFADQKTGGYTSWPKEDFCERRGGSDPFEPRTRPWYAAGATGPKDVIIIADVSGSMGTANRFKLAEDAVKKILDTMTWKDFATIILFNDGVKAVFSETMVPVTDANRNAMKSWCTSQSWRGGGTNFKAPLDRAFEIMEKSISAGTTSMCQKAIMFLTDGVDGSYNDFANLASKSKQYDAVVFTYALGGGADTTKTKQMACENRGIFYPVADGANLGEIMSKYYEYFSHGQEICSASFVSYTSITGGQTLYAGCMAAYDRTGPTTDLLGVTCTDVNLLTDISAWKSKPGFPFFTCTASDMTKQCRQLDLMECQLQKLRAKVSANSVCTSTKEQIKYESAGDSTICPCRDQKCRDDPTFTDEKGYFCDTWVGDDCTNPPASFGYSQAGLAKVRDKCPKSCNRCDWSNGQCGRTVAEECPIIPVATECRACLGRTSGVDMEQRPMKCPPGAPRNIAPTDKTSADSSPAAATPSALLLPAVTAALAGARLA